MALIYLVSPVKGRGVNLSLLTHTLVRGLTVDVSKETVHYFLFRVEFIRPTMTVEFDYRLRFVRSRRTMRHSDLK